VNDYRIGLLAGHERANVLCFPKKLCSEAAALTVNILGHAIFA